MYHIAETTVGASAHPTGSSGGRIPSVPPHVLAACGVAVVAVATAVATVDTRAAAAIAFAAALAGAGYARLGQDGGDSGGWEFKVDPSLPTTTVKVKLVGRGGGGGGASTGSSAANAAATPQASANVELVCNPEVHTVADVHRRVAQIGTLELGSFALVCGFPPTTLRMDDEETTVAAAGLRGALVTQRATK
jgi:hypothetical protein